MKELVNVILVNFFLVEQESLALERITGLFGPNGSGKSSVLDAIQIAKMGANGNQISLNAQADDKSVRRSPRKIRDYVLGRYGVEDGQTAREEATSYVTLIYRDSLTREPLSMGVCLHADRNRDEHEVLGRYVVPGVELALADHVSRAGDETTPLDWAAFHVHLERKAKVSGVNEFTYASSDRFQEAYLLALRSSEGRASLEAFRKAFRFALRMRFDETVENIVKNQVLEARPVDVKRFKQVVSSFGEVMRLVERTKAKLKAASQVKHNFDRALLEARKVATWRALAADVQSEIAVGHHDAAMRGLDAAQERLESIGKQLEESTRSKSFADSEVDRLAVLITGHVAHQKQGMALAQLREKEGVLSTSKGEFVKAVSLLSRLLEASALDPDLAALATDARREGGQLAAAGQLAAGHMPREDVKATLTPALDAASKAFQGLTTALGRVDTKKSEIEERIRRHQGNLERLRGGRAPLHGNVLELQRALSDAGVVTEAVCDLVRVKDPQWQQAIEAYLGPNREALLIMRTDQEALAFDIYRGTKRLYGVKLALASQNSIVHPPAPGTVAELLVGENIAAVVYLRTQFGSTIRASDSGAIKKQRALTSDGMLVSGGALERLRPPESLLLGGTRGAPEEITRITREMETAKRELELLDRRAAELRQLHSRLGIFADAPEAMETFLARYDSLRGAQASVEALRAILESEADQEYAGLVEQQGRYRTQSAELDGAVSTLREGFGRASSAVENLGGEVDRRSSDVNSARASAATMREEADFDSQMALADWDVLDRECGGQLEKMGVEATQRSEKAARGKTNAVVEAQRLLAAFVIEFAEHVPEGSRHDDTERSWRATAEWVAERVGRLEGTDLPQYEEQVKEAYKTAQDTFKNDVAVKIHENIVYMEETFERLNAVLRTCPSFSNGERYQFHKKLRPEHDALHRFIKGVGSGVDADLFGDEDAVPPEFRQLLEQQTGPERAAERTPLQDYREFYTFDIEILQDDPMTGGSRRAAFLSKRLGPSSGGEHRAPLYVIAGAALASAYRITKGASGGMRLMLLDEAFDKMDDTNIVSTLQYLESLGLQVILAGPGKDLGVLNAFLYRYYEVSRDTANQALAFAGHSLTQAARDLNRSDRYEFHPALLEAEIRAMKAVESTTRASQVA